MKLARILNLVLAASLAVLLPLEQAHCAWMGLEKQASRSAGGMSPDHSCCRPLAKSMPHRGPQPEAASQGCMCEQLPKGAIPAAIALGLEAPTVTSFAMPTAPSLHPPVSIVTETVPAPDVGWPPPPHVTAAHGLRAPPATS
jgi:hypothetical protein